MGMNCQPGPETAALGAWRLRSRAEPQLSSVSTSSLFRRTSCPGKSQVETGSEGHSSVCPAVCTGLSGETGQTISSELEAGERQRWVSPLGLRCLSRGMPGVGV